MSARSEKRWVRRCLDQHAAESTDKHNAEVLRAHRCPRVAVTPLTNEGPSKAAVRRWMRLNAAEYDGATALAEAAAAEFDVPESWLDDPVHWIWDIALTEESQ